MRKERIVFCKLLASSFASLLILCSFIQDKSIKSEQEYGSPSCLIEENGRINSVGRWANLDDKNWTYSIIDVTPGSEVYFKCYRVFFMAFLSSYEKPLEGDNPFFCSTIQDNANRMSFNAGVYKLKVPEDCHHIYISRKVSGQDNTPRYLYVDYTNVLDGFLPITVYDVFDDIPCDKQQVCIHHDSFCRNVTGKKWHIGSNGGEIFPMNYLSPSDDYSSIDDGFRITNGCLTNDKSVNVKEAFRLIERAINKESIIEIGLPDETGSRERVIINFQDVKNFESFQVTRKKKKVIIESISRADGKETTKRIFSRKIRQGVLRFYFFNYGTKIYLNKKEIASSQLAIDPNLSCGLMIDNNNTYRYDFFNVFIISPYRLYDDFSIGAKHGIVQDYSYSVDSVNAQLSPLVERFELRSNTVTDYTNDRVENSLNYQLQTNLRKIKVEFDVLLPLDYEIDSTMDCIMQIHDRPDDELIEGRSPYFAIRVKNDTFYLTTMSIEKHSKSGFKINKTIPLRKCEMGKWTHFSIYLKEGYLFEHSPVTRILINEELVYESFDPNVNNNPRGGYIRYGIYKSSWLRRVDEPIKKKVLYFDNVNVIM